MSSPANSSDSPGPDGPRSGDYATGAGASPGPDSGPGGCHWTDGQSRETIPGDQLSTSGPQDPAINNGGAPSGLAAAGDLRVVPQCGGPEGSGEPINSPNDGGSAHAPADDLSDRQVTGDRLRGLPGGRPHPTPFVRRLHRCWSNARRASGASPEPPLIPNRFWRANLNRGEGPCCQGNDPAAWKKSGHLVLCAHCETIGTPRAVGPCVEHPSILIHEVNYHGAFESVYWAQIVDGGEVFYNFYHTILPSNHGWSGHLVACGQGIPSSQDGHWTIRLQMLLLPDGVLSNLRLFANHIISRWTTYAQVPYPLKESAWVCGEKGLIGTLLQCDQACQQHHLEVTPAMYHTLLGDYNSTLYLDEKLQMQVDFWYSNHVNAGPGAHPPYPDFIIHNREGMPPGKWAREIASLPFLSDCIEIGIQRNIQAMEILTVFRHALNVSYDTHWEEAFYTVQSHLSQLSNSSLSQTATAAQAGPEIRDPLGVEPRRSSGLDGSVEPPPSPSLLAPCPRPQVLAIEPEAQQATEHSPPQCGKCAAGLQHDSSGSNQEASTTSLDLSDVRSPSPPIARPKNKLQRLKDLLRPQASSTANRRSRGSSDSSQAVETPFASTPTKGTMPLFGDLEMSTINETSHKEQSESTQLSETQQ